MRSVLALALLLAGGGCAVAPPAGGYSPAPHQRMLRAQITASGSGYGGLGFYVNQPAYVALFEVVPGLGTSMLYPGPGVGRMDGFVFGGMQSLHRLNRYGRGHNRDMYLSAYGSRAQMGPRYLFLIASERPLELGHLGGFGMGLRGSLGVHFASMSAYDVMERLAEEVLPTMAYDGSWTTDMYVDWPDMLYDSPRADRALVTCNGYRVYVPIGQVHAVREALCRGERFKERPRLTPRDSAAAPSDSGAVTRPGRRRPVPAAGAATLRERITSSTQLEEEGRRGAEEAHRRRGRVVRGEEREAEQRGRVRPEPRRVPDERSRGKARAAERPSREPAQRERPAPAASPRTRPERAKPAAAPRSSGAERPSRARPTPRNSGQSSGCDPCESL